MFEVVFLSVIAGVVGTLIVQWLLLKKWFLSMPVVKPPWNPQYDKYELPKELKDALNDPELKDKKESCATVNLVFQFIFQELKDTNAIRRWVMRRMNMEFAEMLQTTTGKLLDQITVRDFNLGATFPIIKNATIKDVQLKDDAVLEELSMELDLTYSGGFQLAVDVDMVFGKSAYLCVKVTKLQGIARLQFTRLPYTHWSFAFIEDPVIEFEVDSHFEGRTIPQITSLIINQIRRSVRKKHTLPNYKIRYRPFFIKPERKPPTRDIYYRGKKLSVGQLVVSVLSCNRLVKISTEGFIYCTLAIDSLPWVELMSSRRKLWVSHDIEIVRGQAQNIGLTFKEEFILDKYDEMVVVDYVTPNSPANKAEIRKNDLVLAVGGTKITSCKQVAKLMKQAGERFIVRIERSSSLKGIIPSASEIKFEEDTEGELVESEGGSATKDEPSDDYINITISDPNALESSTSGASKEKPIEDAPPSPSGSMKSLFPGRGTTGLFHRKKIRESKSPRDSPEMATRVQHQTQDDGEQGMKMNPDGTLATAHVKQRSKSDAGLVYNNDKDKDNQPSIKLDSQSLHSQSTEGPTSSSGLQADKTAAETDSFHLKKTKLVKVSQNPVFGEKFEFDLEDSHSYLNVCVWCRIPEKLDKQQRVVKSEKDVLLGHISIPLMDISLECLTTLQGDFQSSYKLTPAEMKAGASRTKISSLAAHPGFEERLCYGDINLAFLHATHQLSKTERARIEKIKLENESQEDISTQETQTVTEKKVIQEGRHDFVNTHFQSATYCNFCLKKIWLKTAFRCQVCEMVCHKKCIEKCQAQTQCSKDNRGMFRQPELAAMPPRGRKGSKERTPPKSAAIAVPNSTPPKTGLFSKFRKDGSKNTPNAKGIVSNGTPKVTKRSPSPESSGDRKRHNSAPEDSPSGGSVSDGEGTAKSSDKLLTVGSVPRTRSSASLQDLIKDNAPPKLQEKEVAGNDSYPESSESSDEDELNLMKYCEKQRGSNNADEVVVTAAKEMGKELYTYLTHEERREKLDNMVSKLQVEIDQESEHRSALSKLEHEASDPSQRAAIRNKVDNSDEKIQSLALLMLHYCAGLQHCMDQQEIDKPDDMVAIGNQPQFALEKLTGFDESTEDIAVGVRKTDSPKLIKKSHEMSLNGAKEKSSSTGSVDKTGRGDNVKDKRPLSSHKGSEVTTEALEYESA